MHHNEEEVKIALQYKPNDPMRKQQFGKICRMGNFNHNVRVLATKEGELKVARRPSSDVRVNPDDYLPCKICNGFFPTDELSRHASMCMLQEGEERKISAKRLRYEGRLLLSGNEHPSGFSQELYDNVLSIMSTDDVSAVAQTDETILILGSSLIDKRGNEKGVEVSQQMRLLARVVIEARKLLGNAKASLADLLKPGHFDLLITCAKNLGGCHSSANAAPGKKQFKSPSTAIKCGYSMKKAALVLRGQALRAKHLDLKNDIDIFLELYEAEWGDKITAPALDDLSYKKHNAPQLLPITADLVLLRECLVGKVKMLTNEVRENPTKENWRYLAEVTLARVIMFNKRRGSVNEVLSYPKMSR